MALPLQWRRRFVSVSDFSAGLPSCGPAFLMPMTTKERAVVWAATEYVRLVNAKVSPPELAKAWQRLLKAVDELES